jgi:hypothetical protein
MDLKSIFISSILALTVSIGISQTTDSINLPKLKLSSAQFIRGFQVGNTNEITAEYFKNLDPSLQPMLDDSKFNESNQFSPTSKPINLGLYAEFQKLKKDKVSYKNNQTIRVGLWYQQRTLGTMDGLFEQSKNIDTLTSDLDGQQIYRMQKHNERYRVSHEVTELKFDASYMFRSNDEYKITVYGGVGANIGSSFYSKINVSYVVSDYEKYSLSSIASSDLTQNTGYLPVNSEKYLKNYATIGLYCPLGLDYRLSMNHDFYDKFHVIFEARPSVDLIQGYKFWSMHYNVGLKLDL